MKTITFLSTILLLGVFNILYSQNQSTSPPIHYLDPYNPEYVEGEILVKFRDEVQINIQQRDNQISTGLISIDDFLIKYEATALTKIFKSNEKKETRYISTHNGERIEVPQLFNIYKLKFNSTRDAKELAELLSEDPLVEFAEPNYLVYTMDTYPDDPYYTGGNQWYIDAVNAPAAWDSTTCDTTQIIGIIDTGVDWDHPDLDDNIWTNWDEIPDNGIDDDANGFVDDVKGWDFVNDDNDPNDDNSHGTHVAGIAAAETNNSIGIAGIAWNARIMPVKMLQSSGSGSSSDLASAIEYASDNGATVINMSLGSYGESSTVKIALENAYATSVLVAAAGNNGYKVDPPCPPFPIYAPMFPACYSFIIGVEATTAAGTLASFSNYDPSGPIVAGNSFGHNYEIKAPGVNIFSTFPNGNYKALNGTSMASPIVAGAIALMKDYDPVQSTEQIFARLIQGADNGILDIENSLDYELVPDLYYLEYTLIDTLPGCDNDGIADAGETIEIYLTVKNGGGLVDSVWSKLRFGASEDTTVANIIDSTSYIGDISAYATLTGELDPFRIEIDPDVVNNRDIVFEYEIGANNFSSFTGELIITVQNGIEFSGLYENLVHLTPDKYYIITGNVVFDSLIIDPGTIIRLNPNAAMFISSYLFCEGTPDSMILFTSNGVNSWNRIENVSTSVVNFEYCIFENATGAAGECVLEGVNAIKNCILRNNIYNTLNLCYYYPREIHNCMFINNQGYRVLEILADGVENNVVVNNSTQWCPAVRLWNETAQFPKVRNNAVFSNSPYNFGASENLPWGIYHLAPNYHGIIDSAEIENNILDFFENSSYPIILGDSALVVPPAECHGVVWKIDINDILVNKYDNPYNSPVGLGVVGAETLKFDVYFNRAMDTIYTPFLTFGVREPYTQHIVQGSASWSADSTIWTAYHTVGLETGDGINTIRVANAKDTDHFEIPIEDSRFEFVIQAAGAQSIAFIATPGIGKVDLEWPPANTPDVLGYNLYRFYNLTDTTYSDTTLINSELILDTLYTDFDVIPDTTYHYLYTILGTDMAESDYSKKVTAIPFNAANGDANGDLSVNVLDITTIVSYMLNQNPTPFLFDAADVNSDDEINVLDIIGIIQLISAEKSVPLSNLIYTASEPAYISIEENGIYLESEGNVAALQFKVQSSKFKDQDFNSHLATRNPHQLDKLKIFSLQKGFEFAYGIVDDHIIGLLFSLTDKEIPAGDQELFRFEGIDISEIEITDIFGGDLNGDYVPVLKKGEQSSMKLPEGYELTVQPNPFTNSTLISWQLAEEAMVDISICNLKGEKIKQIEQGYQPVGHYNKTWNGGDESQKQLPTGIYICHMEIKINDMKISKDVKIISIK